MERRKKRPSGVAGGSLARQLSLAVWCERVRECCGVSHATAGGPLVDVGRAPVGTGR